MKKFLVRLCVLAFSLGTVTLLPSPAAANYIVGGTGSTSCSGLNMHDSFDSTISYRRASLETNNHNAVGWAFTNAVNPTDLSSYSTSSTWADFTYYDWAQTSFCGMNWYQPGSGGVVGFAKCHALTGSACDAHRVYFTTTYTSGQGTTTLRKLACHETGHSIGITHNTHSGSSLDSCMKTPSSGGTTTYSSHEINDMINFVW